VLKVRWIMHGADRKHTNRVRVPRQTWNGFPNHNGAVIGRRGKPGNRTKRNRKWIKQTWIVIWRWGRSAFALPSITDSNESSHKILVCVGEKSSICQAVGRFKLLRFARLIATHDFGSLSADWRHEMPNTRANRTQKAKRKWVKKNNEYSRK
jgi:hypothetical protein